MSRLDDFTSQVRVGAVEHTASDFLAGVAGCPVPCALPCAPHLILAPFLPVPCPVGCVGTGQYTLELCIPALVPGAAVGAHHPCCGPQDAQHEPAGDLKFHLELCQVSRRPLMLSSAWHACHRSQLPQYLHTVNLSAPLVSSLPGNLSLWHLLVPTCRFAYHPGPVMAQYQVEVMKRVHQFDGQSLTTTMWAMAVLSVSRVHMAGSKGLHGHGCGPASVQLCCQAESA